MPDHPTLGRELRLPSPRGPDVDAVGWVDEAIDRGRGIKGLIVTLKRDPWAAWSPIAFTTEYDTRHGQFDVLDLLRQIVGKP